jgi:DNA-binding winged helix-turn-helix (wHTH) protein
VLRAGVPQSLGGSAFDLLRALIERRGEVFGKDELTRRVWPGLVVEGVGSKPRNDERR